MISSQTSNATDTTSMCSEASTQVEGAVPDRHGFMGGSQYSPDPRQGPPPDTVKRREKKWLKMLNKWEIYMDKNYQKVRERCRKGIPMSLRPRAWLYLCGGKLLLERHMGLYASFCHDEGNRLCLQDIRKDLHRQFPHHEMFMSEERPGQKELEMVLKAYTMWNPKDGYCQAQAPVAAFLLMYLPAEQAFWCLVSVCDNYLTKYYAPGLEMVQRDGDMLEALLKRTCSPAYRHLRQVKAEPVLYMTEWFLCAFTRTLPWDSLLRIWDIFLCEGIKVFFKTALVILGGCLGPSKYRKQCPGLCETLELLRHPPSEVLEEQYLVLNMAKLQLTEHDFQLEHQRQTTRRRQMHQQKEATSGTTANKSSNKHITDR